MKTILPLALLAALCVGCLSSAPPAPSAWLVSGKAGLAPAAPRAKAFAVTRLSALSVSAPYDRTPFVVRRADGSAAFDAYNVFAASPASLLRDAVRTRLEADGRFGRVVGASSLAAADATVEAFFTELSLDCTKAGTRTARASVRLDVLRGRARTLDQSGDGVGTADAADGDYAKAFSAAIDAALADALSRLR